MNASVNIVKALEDEGARWVFGIPGTHNLELWDALGRSAVEPFLVADERSAAFLADGIARSSGRAGVLAVVPGAGVTHALSGIAEALLDGVPMVVLACAIRSDTGRAYQLHDIDQTAILRAASKAVLKPSGAAEAYAAVRGAFALAQAGCPGPVVVELPAELLFGPRGAACPAFSATGSAPPLGERAAIGEAARLLNASRWPMIYAGSGAAGACDELLELASKLGSPVATTISGKGVYPERHPLWLWNGFGLSAPPFVQAVAGRADAMLALGARFGEVATGSYGCRPPGTLIHVDIDASVPGRNYPARLAVTADVKAFLAELLPLLHRREPDGALLNEIAEGRRAVRAAAIASRAGGLLTPAVFFPALQSAAGPDAVYAVDSGQGMFLAMEHLRLEAPRRFLAPTDFSCMGYSVPAAIGAKLAAPQRTVAALTGDGAFLMTGMELLTASARGIAPMIFVLRDGELGQIAEFQSRALGRKTATAVAPYELKALAGALGCAYVELRDDRGAQDALASAAALAAQGRPVVVETALAPAETYFTKGVIAANFGRLPLLDKARLAARLAARKIAG